MGFISDLTGILRKRAPSLETKQAPQVMINYTSGRYTKRNTFKELADEGYCQNAIVYRCVNEIANGAAAIQFKVTRGDEELEFHPIIDLLNRPNPLQAGTEYFQSLYSYLLLSGNSYAVASEVNDGVAELHILRPDRMEVIPSKTAIPEGYNYKINGQIVQSYAADPVTGQSEIKHFKFWNPLDDFYGMSPLMAGAIDIDQHNMISRHNIGLLANGARPTGAIIFKPADDRGLPIQLTDMQRKQLYDDVQSKFSGPDNAGRPLLLEGDFDWREMGISPKDMDFISQKNISARDIALCFGVPSQLVGIPDAQTYSNIQEARLALYEETIIPLAKRVESDLNEWLAPRFDDQIKITYDMDNIPAMVERRRRIYENVTAAVREGIITRNEARERLGLEEIQGGDEILVQANLFPISELGSSEVDTVDPEEAGKDAYFGDDWDIDQIDETKEELERDVFTTEREAQDRASEIGCVGTHSHDRDGRTIYMPCRTHDEYDEALGSYKAESDVNLKPTAEMAREAVQALEWRKEFNRGGTEVGVARAVQLKNRENLSPSTVRRMFSFFSRHEVDKRAEGFRRGEKGYPTAGRVAWGLWGGDAGFSWSRRKVKELDAEKAVDELIEDFAIEGADESKATPISAKIKEALKNKVKDHNDKHGDAKSKRVTQRMLEAVFRRGVGAYHTNPQSVRPNVRSPDQWGLGRVNAFLRAVRTGRFPSGKFDTDLLPDGHPLASKD